MTNHQKYPKAHYTSNKWVHYIFMLVIGSYTSLVISGIQDDEVFGLVVPYLLLPFILILVLVSIPITNKNRYRQTSESTARMGVRKLNRTLQKRGWKWVNKDIAERMLSRYGNSSYCIPDENDVHQIEGYEYQSEDFLNDLMQRIHQERIQQYEDVENLYPTAPITKCFIILCTIASVLAVSGRYFLYNTPYDRSIFLLSFFGFLTLVVAVGLSIAMTRIHLRNKGYDWVSLKNTAKLLFCVGPKTRKLPDRVELEEVPIYRKYDVTSLIVLAEKL